MGDLPGDDRQSAVLEPGRDHLETGLFGDVRDILRRRIGAKVNIGNRNAHQGIAHAAADKQRLKPLSLKRGAERLRAGLR